MSTPPGPPQDPNDPRYPQQPGYPGTPPQGYPQQPGYPGTPPDGYPQQPDYPGTPPQGYPGQAYPPYPDAGYGPVAPPPGDPLVPADFGGWFERIFGVVQRSFVQLLLLQIAAFLALGIVGGIAGAAIAAVLLTSAVGSDGPGFGAVVLAVVIGLIAVVVIIVVNALVQGASVFIAIRQATGEDAAFGPALTFARGRMLAIIGWGLLAGLLLIVGFVLVILPGVYLAIVFGAALVGVVIVERGGIGRCFTLVNAQFLPTAGRMLIYFVALFAYSFVVGLIVSAFGEGSIVGLIVQLVLSIPVGIVGVAVAVVTYAELRFREHPGVLTPTLAAELRR